jgi:hypothetical protein
VAVYQGRPGFPPQTPSRQAGAVLGQLASATHWTHFPAALQNPVFGVPAQSAFVRH